MLEQILLIALVQGITEFLPISSSAHLDLLAAAGFYPAYSGPSQKLALDVAVHLGTLVAVILYNHRELLLMAGAVIPGLRSARRYRPLVMALVLGTIPVVVAGFWLNGREDLLALLDGIEVIAWATLAGGILLALADRMPGRRRFDTITPGHGIPVGLAQMLALIPGVSRAGITMTMARILGFDHAAAMRFSMLLAIPVIAGAGLLKGLDMAGSGGTAEFRWLMAVAGFFSMLVALMAIRIMMAVVERVGFMPFVLYRIALAGGLLAIVYLG